MRIFTRSVKLDCNQIAASDRECIQYYRDKFIGISISQFASEYSDYVFKDQVKTMPLAVNTFEEHHLPIDLVKSIIEHSYSISIKGIHIIEGFYDTNFKIVSTEHEKEQLYWSKLILQSALVDNVSINVSCHLQNWLNINTKMSVPFVRNPSMAYKMVDEKSVIRRQSLNDVMDSDYCIIIEQHRTHLIWLLNYIENIKRISVSSIHDIHQCVPKFTKTIKLFHESCEQYIQLNRQQKPKLRQFLTLDSIKSDLEMMAMKTFMIDNQNTQKLLLCCAHYFKETLMNFNDEIHMIADIKMGIIHTQFSADCLVDCTNGADADSTYTVMHFVSIKQGFLLTDYLMAAWRLYVHLKCSVITTDEESSSTVVFNDILMKMLQCRNFGSNTTDSDRYCFKDQCNTSVLQGSERKLLYPLLLCVGAWCIVEFGEQVMILSSHQGYSNTYLSKLKLSLDVSIKLLEDLCRTTKLIGSKPDAVISQQVGIVAF